jgi:very-short-patch-repair endonuclease
LKEKAKQLRQDRNLSEVLFWKQVTKGGFHNIDFDRQRVIGNYIVDFMLKDLGWLLKLMALATIVKWSMILKEKHF